MCVDDHKGHILYTSPPFLALHSAPTTFSVSCYLILTEHVTPNLDMVT